MKNGKAPVLDASTKLDSCKKLTLYFKVVEVGILAVASLRRVWETSGANAIKYELIALLSNNLAIISKHKV